MSLERLAASDSPQQKRSPWRVPPVVVADHNEKLLNEAAEKLRGEGHNVLAVTCDVSDKAQVAAMIDLAVKTYGRLDAAFNNAGINCKATPMAETDDEVFDRLININLRGAWNCMKGDFVRCWLRAAEPLLTVRP